jgi:hypothetical protein
MDRYEQMRSGQKEAQPTPSVMVPVNEASQLPAISRTAPAAATPAKP